MNYWTFYETFHSMNVHDDDGYHSQPQCKPKHIYIEAEWLLLVILENEDKDEGEEEKGDQKKESKIRRQLTKSK